MAKKTEKAPIRPLGDRVLLRDLTETEKERKLSSGLILPATVKDEKSGAKRGLVVAVGPGKVGDDNERIPLSVEVGDIVLFSWGDDLELDDVKYHIVTENNILGIVNE